MGDTVKHRDERGEMVAESGGVEQVRRVHIFWTHHGVHFVTGWSQAQATNRLQKSREYTDDEFEYVGTMKEMQREFLEDEKFIHNIDGVNV